IVTGTADSQVRILYRADAHLPGAYRDLLLAQFLVLVPDHRRGPLDSLGEQTGQRHRVARPGAERAAVRPEYGAEHDVPRVHTIGQRPGPGAGVEDHREVQRLPAVHHVPDGVRAEVRHPVTQRGEVGDGVPVPAVGLAHDQRYRLTVPSGHA